MVDACRPQERALAWLMHAGEQERDLELFDFNTVVLHFPHDLVCVILKTTGHISA
jgi:hypothetical protein